jgi:nucleoside-diphosphate-sugar epimerase
VEDVARAFIAVLEAPRAVVHDRFYNVGTNAQNHRVRDVAEMVRSAVPGARVAFEDGAGPDLRNYRVDFSRFAEEVPGFVPRWTVENGIAELREAYSAAMTTLPDFLGPRLVRLAAIRARRAAGQVGADLRPAVGVP